MNNCTFFGRLGADPEIKNTNSGQKVARFNLAVNRTWVGKDGQKQESTTWMTCIAWEKLAETAEKHLKKGQRVLVKNVSKMHPLLSNCLRLTVGTPDENALLLQALQQSL